MKTQPVRPWCVIASTVLFTVSLGPLALGQGALTPPGAPAPTLKTLQQVEPRTDIMTVPGDGSSLHTITAPGSYYLTANIQGTNNKYGICIYSDNVTLDLNGFALIGANTSLAGINIAGVSNVIIYNGKVCRWPWVGVSGDPATGCRYEKLTLAYNGDRGITTGTGAELVDCMSISNASSSLSRGFSIGPGGILTRCQSVGDYGGGFFSLNNCTFNECMATRTSGDGFDVSSNCVFQGCTAIGNSGRGISANQYDIIKNCTASANGSDGIVVVNACTVVDNTANQNGIDGIHVVFGTANRIDSNHAMDNGFVGIRIETDGSEYNLVVRNTAGGTDNEHPGFGFDGGTTYGPVVMVAHGMGGPISTPATGWENFQWYMP